MRGVGRQLAQMHGLVHHALAGERRVAVHYDSHYLNMTILSEGLAYK